MAASEARVVGDANRDQSEFARPSDHLPALAAGTGPGRATRALKAIRGGGIATRLAEIGSHRGAASVHPEAIASGPKGIAIRPGRVGSGTRGITTRPAESAVESVLRPVVGASPAVSTNPAAIAQSGALAARTAGGSSGREHD